MPGPARSLVNPDHNRPLQNLGAEKSGSAVRWPRARDAVSSNYPFLMTLLYVTRTLKGARNFLLDAENKNGYIGRKRDAG